MWSVQGAAGFSSVGALARLPQAMAGLGAVVMITGLDGSYTVAGAVAGMISFSQGLLAPQVSRLADRFGQTRVVAPQAVVNVAALCGLVFAAYRHAGPGVLIGFGALVGVSLPQIGALTRARWTALLRDDRRLDTALAVESLIEEAVFVIGPVVVVAAASSMMPAAGLLIAAVLVAVGCSLLLAQRATEPPPQPGAAAGHASAATAHAGLWVLIAVFLGIGVLFGFIEVGVVALTREHDRPGVSGVMLALWAAGSLISGILYGTNSWHAGAVRRFVLGVGAMAAGTVLVAGCSGSLTATTVALVVAGTANAPTLITGNALVAVVVSAHAVTEAYTWLGVSVFAGIAVGVSAGGVLVDGAGGVAALWAATGAGIVAAVVAVSGRRRLHAPTE
ncbi:MFS transporter [Streptomyces humi]|uniref:MFS transporter n=1 Tax=Streptomyces humi TaxID=1428620 RepID=UPI001160DFAF|nr:MFS transporter [Streptomyces humi]